MEQQQKEQEQEEQEAIEASIDSRYSFWVREALDELPHSFSIADPSIPGHPIVYASRELLKMCGYTREEVVGEMMMKMMKMFLQGGSRRSVMEIRHAVREERSIQVPLFNFHKNGTPFWVLFHMFPVFCNQDGRLLHFVALQLPFNSNSNSNSNSVLGFCRREVELITTPNNNNNIPPNLDEDHHHHHHHHTASELEKQVAKSAMGNILSMLTHYSQLTGRLVSENRCCSTYMSAVGASLNLSLAPIKQSFVLTDPHKPNFPIVYASDAFLHLTGYARHQVLGRSCRFLSGHETDVSTELQITNSIETGKSCTACILNYRNDGSPFWNSLHISPVRNASGKIVYFVEVQMNVNCHEKQQSLRPEMSVVAAVKVAVRASGMIATTSKS